MANKKVTITVDEDSRVTMRMEGCGGDNGAVDFQKMLRMLNDEYGVSAINKQEHRTSGVSTSSTNKSSVSA